MSDFINQDKNISVFNNSGSWLILNPIEQSIRNKIDKYGTPLKDMNVKIFRGVITGCNEAFIIDEETKNRLITDDPKSAEIIRPILRGKDIKRYNYNFADLFLIIAKYGSYKYLESEYPAIYHHLFSYKNKLENRGQCRYTSSGKQNTAADYIGQHHWLELDNNPSDKYLDDLFKQKIVYREISTNMDACLIPENICVNNKCYFLTGSNLEYLVLIFNSKLFNSIILREANTTGGKGNKFLENIHIPSPSEETVKLFIELYRKRVTCSNEDIEELEARIDEEVYKLYKLENTEIQYIKRL